MSKSAVRLIYNSKNKLNSDIILIFYFNPNARYEWEANAWVPRSMYRLVSNMELAMSNMFSVNIDLSDMYLFLKKKKKKSDVYLHGERERIGTNNYQI